MQRVIVGLARGLNSDRLQAEVVAPHSPSGQALVNWAAAQGVRIRREKVIRDAAASHSLRDVVRFALWLRKHDYDVVNLHYGDVFISLKDVLAVRLSGRRKCVISVHQVRSWSEAGDRKRRLTGLAGRMADAVIVTSEAMERLMIEAGVPSARIRVIECGVAMPELLPTRDEARRHLGLPADAFIVSAVARFEKHKGIHDVIEACSSLVDGRDVVLLLAGDGPERARLERWARQRMGARARFLGRLEDPVPVYASSDVFCLPSHVEGFGLVYLEAALHGVPSIGANVGGVPRAIQSDVTGILVEPGDVRQVVDALERLRRDVGLRAQMGAAAKLRVRSEFSEEQMVRRYKPLFGAMK